VAHDILDNGICIDCPVEATRHFNPREPREPPTPIEDRWALDVKLQSAQPVAARSAHHELRNGICITCETT